MFKSSNALLALALLAGCTASDMNKQTQLGAWQNPSGAAKQLDVAAYENLSPEQQYAVINKLTGTLYKGVSVDEFFDLSKGLKPGSAKQKSNISLSTVANKLSARLPDRETYVAAVNSNHAFYDTRAVATPLATIFEMPLSRDLFENWMAYELANTILFSPAEEIDSAGFDDVDWMYNRLVDWMRKDKSVSDIAYAYMTSEANWRRFRSPEDNTREMIEIFLGLFDRDEDVPRAAKACKNWWISEENGDYILKVDVNKQNSEPQLVLDQWVVTCEEVYKAIASHPLLIPRVTTVLVDRFFANSTQEKRGELIQSILDIKPSTFPQIFAAIVLSEEYLLHNERPKSYEETMMNVASRIKWKPWREYFNNVTSMRTDVNKTLKQMSQPTMSLKLGRFKDQPLDSLSFAHYHKAMREDILTRYNSSYGWSEGLLTPIKALKTDEEWIDYVFLSVIGRRATTQEMSALLPLTKTGESWAKVSLVMDYLSRLPELYFLTKSDLE